MYARALVYFHALHVSCRQLQKHSISRFYCVFLRRWCRKSRGSCSVGVHRVRQKLLFEVKRQMRREISDALFLLLSTLLLRFETWRQILWTLIKANLSITCCKNHRRLRLCYQTNYHTSSLLSHPDRTHPYDLRHTSSFRLSAKEFAPRPKEKLLPTMSILPLNC